MRFKDKVVIVTGSTSGIGQTAALRYAQEGAKVTLHGRNEQKMQETLQLLRDAGVPDENLHHALGAIEEETVQKRLIDETVAKFGQLDVLVNNAGMPNRSDLDPNSLENLDYIFKINVRSMIAMTKFSAPELAKTKGNVVNISSAAAQQTTPGFTPYCVTKAAVDHFTRNAAAEYGAKDIRVNTISPGFTLTNISEHYGIPKDQAESFWHSFIQEKVPLRRFGKPDDIVNGILFMSSPDASYITGANLVIDGGMLIGSLVNPQL